MRALISGATGLLGGALLGLMVKGGHEVRCLVREESPNLSRLPEGVEVVRGDAGSEEDLVRALGGVEAMVHVAGIEHAPQVVAACRRTGVGRLVVVGSTSVHSRYEFRSGMRKEMEEVVRGSGLGWTIARPAMIYGSELDKNMHKLLRFLDRSPVFPLFGPGTNLWQPVYFEDCAAGVLAALESERAVQRSYDLPGPEPRAYRELVETAARALGRKPRLLPLPLEPVRRVLAMAEGVGLSLPVKSEQVLRLREDKAYPLEEAKEDLGYDPRPFREGISLEVERLRALGMLRSG
jgi:uncharacterized protein YbjT (DUF2867 family)